MPRQLPPTAQLRSFVEVVHQGRLNRAAEVLDLTESAVSHHLRKLEELLGVRLLERSRAQVRLTQAGERFHARAAEALSLLSEAVEELGGEGAAERVLLTLPRAVAAHWLVPRYPALYRRYDDLELQLLPTARQCDLAREQIDLGIRLGRGDWPGLESRLLMPERICPVATPQVARQWRESGWDSMTGQGRLIANQTHADEWSRWCEETRRELPAGSRFTGLESFDLVLQAGLAGSGLIMGRTPMVNDAIARGDLEAPFPDWIDTGVAYHVVWPERRPPNRYGQRVLEWLMESAEEGTGPIG